MGKLLYCCFDLLCKVEHFFGEHAQLIDLVLVHLGSTFLDHAVHVCIVIVVVSESNERCKE